jgi:hypothetical protein
LLVSLKMSARAVWPFSCRCAPCTTQRICGETQRGCQQWCSYSKEPARRAVNRFSADTAALHRNLHSTCELSKPCCSNVTLGSACQCTTPRVMGTFCTHHVAACHDHRCPLLQAQTQRVTHVSMQRCLPNAKLHQPSSVHPILPGYYSRRCVR